MLKDKLVNLFDCYDPAIKTIIHEVLRIEQANISMEKPRVKDDIDAVVTTVTTAELSKPGNE